MSGVATQATVRMLTIADLPAALPLIEAFSRYADPDEPFRAEKARDTWMVLMGHGYGILLGAWLDGALIGLFGMTVRPNLYNERILASELVWWVTPEHRDSGAGVQLLQRAEQIATEKGARWLTLGQYLDRLETRAVGVFYRRKGYHAFGVGHRKELTHV